MQSKATTPKQYIDELPEERKVIIAAIRSAVKDNLPTGFEEVISYGMIGYVIPHSIYPAGYHCNPKLPLGFINIGSQKNHIAIHHLGLYSSNFLLEWFTAEWEKYSTKKLDMGKGCIRFKKAEDVPLKLIAALAKKVTVDQYIEMYEKALASNKKVNPTF
jgi:uncharacterized protein YdhG (YjbR/CyaY superfamily)